MSLEEKWKKDELVFVHITNVDMVCIDCTYRYDCASMCLLYEIKPSKVFDGEMCDLYEKEQSI